MTSRSDLDLKYGLIIHWLQEVYFSKIDIPTDQKINYTFFLIQLCFLLNKDLFSDIIRQTHKAANEDLYSKQTAKPADILTRKRCGVFAMKVGYCSHFLKR